MLIWKEIADCLPPMGRKVMTKIHDKEGERNVQALKMRQREGGRPMWFLPDDSMYVYYRPTHWAEMPVEGNSSGQGE